VLNLKGMDTRIETLTDTLLDEIVNAVGLRKTPAARRTFGLLFRRAADRLSAIGLAADRMIRTDGFPAACRWMMSHWVGNVTTRGAENIPPEGPLLVVSNHVGAYDILVAPSQVNRPDLKIISSDIKYLKNLPHACEHLIFLTDEPHDRMAATRAGIRQLKEGGSLLLFGSGRIDPDPALSAEAEKHLENWSPSIDLFLRMMAATRAGIRQLKEGGSLLLFGSGRIDPDPALSAEAEKHLENWSPSIDLFLRMAPQVKVVLSIASGFLTSRWMNHPLTRLRRVDWEKRRIAEFGQVLQQLFFPGTIYVSPSVSFAPPITAEELGENPRQKLIEQARRLLADHLARLATPQLAG